MSALHIEEQKTYDIKNLISFLFRCSIVIFIVSLLYASFKDSEDKEDLFKSRFYMALGKNNSVELDFAKLVDFEWNKVCFGYGPPYANLKFYETSMGVIELDFAQDIFYIEANYVRGSPSNKCFNKNQMFKIQRKHTVNGERFVITFIEKGVNNERK